MKTNNTSENLVAGAPYLTPWQKRWIVLAATVIGVTATVLVLRWLEARHTARLAAADQSNDDQS